MASPNSPLDLIITMDLAPQAFLFIPPSSGRVVITFNGTSKDNAINPSKGTTVSQDGDSKANTEVVDVIPGSKAGRDPKLPSSGAILSEGGGGKANTEVVDVIPRSSAGSGTKRPYDAIADLPHQPDHGRAKTEPGGSQAKKREVAQFKFKGTARLPDVNEELLVPIPRSLYGQLTGSPIDLDDSATEPESSSDYEADGHLKRKYLT